MTMIRFSHFTIRPPMNPGMIILTGNPWSGDKCSAFCMYANMISRDGSIAISYLILVPYLEPPPPGKSSAPSKHTLRAPRLRLKIPHCFSTWRKSTPRHTEVETPAAPQLKPMVCFTMFCSFRLFPAQTSVTGISRLGNSVTSWSIVNRMGRLTSPHTSTVQSSHLPLGTGPWFRT